MDLHRMVGSMRRLPTQRGCNSAHVHQLQIERESLRNTSNAAVTHVSTQASRTSQESHVRRQSSHKSRASFQYQAELAQPFGDAKASDMTNTGASRSSGARNSSSCVPVLTEGDFRRQLWEVLLVLALVYTATIMVGRLSFWTLRVGSHIDSDDLFWDRLDDAVSLIFGADLVLNFFFAYEDEDGEQVICPGSIARRYLGTWFCVDALACMPAAIVAAFLQSNPGSTDNAFADSVDVSVKIGSANAKILKMTRLLRLVRLCRFNKVFVSVAYFLVPDEHSRTVRLVKNVGVLLWTVHIVACGWYLVGAFEIYLGYDIADTWLSQREGFVEAPQWEQWFISVYFVLSMFTTMINGDFKPNILPEFIFVMCVMILGTVVNSIIIGQVISILTDANESEQALLVERQHLKLFKDHLHLTQSGVAATLDKALCRSLKRNAVSQYDKDFMRKWFLGDGRFSQRLIAQVQRIAFGGHLIRHSLLTTAGSLLDKTSHLAINVAVVLTERTFNKGELAYSEGEPSTKVFLVMNGTFVAVRRRHPIQLFPSRCYFGDVEIFHHSMRQQTVRCEEPDTEVQILHRKDLQDIMEDFPTVARIWRVHARRRHGRASRIANRPIYASSHLELACVVIQRFWSAWKSISFDVVDADDLYFGMLQGRYRRQCGSRKFLNSQNAVMFFCDGWKLNLVDDNKDGYVYWHDSKTSLPPTGEWKPFQSLQTQCKSCIIKKAIGRATEARCGTCRMRSCECTCSQVSADAASVYSSSTRASKAHGQVSTDIPVCLLLDQRSLVANPKTVARA